MNEILYFVTSNPHKFEEAERILGVKLQMKSMDIKEVQSLDPEVVAKEKVKEAYSILHKPLIVEDTGLHIREWNGFPGALISWVVKTIGVERIPSLLHKNREALAKTCVAFFDGKTLATFCGETKGRITKPRGKRRFDWDRIFVPEGSEKTYAEMSIDEKNLISQRRRAFEKLRDFLRKNNFIR